MVGKRMETVSGVASLAAVVALAACGGEAGGDWAGAVDTLANGAPVVSNPSSGVWDSTSSWRLSEELRIGDVEGDGPEVFGSVAGMVVDDYGRVHVLDRQAGEIRVFDRDGAHVRTVGRSGGGPGELGDPIGITRSPDGRIWIVDPTNNRYSVFDTAGNYLTSHRRNVGGYALPWTGGFDDGGKLIERSIYSGEDGFRPIFVRFDTAFSEADTLDLPPHEDEVFELVTENSRMAYSVPFTPDRVIALAPDGSVWTGVSDAYELAHLSLAADTLRVIRREHDPAPVTDEDREEALENLQGFVEQGGDVDPSRIPDVKPAYAWFAAAPSGHVWVAPVVEGEDVGTVLDVFDPEGRYLGRVRSPITLSQRALTFRDDRLYGLTSDDLGVNYVVRLRIEKGGNGG